MNTGARSIPAQRCAQVLAPTLREAAGTPRVRRRRFPLPWQPVLLDLGAALLTAAVLGPQFLSLLGPPAWLALIAAAGGYRPNVLPCKDFPIAAVSRAAFVLAVAVELSSPWLLPHVRTTALLCLGAASVISATGRIGFREWYRYRGPGGRRRVLVVGDAGQADLLRQELGGSRGHDLSVAAVCLPQAGPVNETWSLSSARLRQVLDAIAGLRPDVVLLAECWPPEFTRRLMWSLEGTSTELFLGPGLLDVSRTRTRVAAAGAVPMIHVRPAVLTGRGRLVKDVAERLAAGVMLLAFAPVLLLAMAAIRLETPGPALFRQVRVGRGGRPFTMYKIRTMTADADVTKVSLEGRNECDAVLFKLRRDPRVTGWGRLLRRYSIDEVPQLLNIVKGDMALVGPRPALPAEVEQYDDDARRRMLVKPGLTGLWQVSGRSDLSWKQSVRLDLRYVDNWSVMLDLVILCRTLRAVIGHVGAY